METSFEKALFTGIVLVATGISLFGAFIMFGYNRHGHRRWKTGMTILLASSGVCFLIGALIALISIVSRLPF